LDSSISGSIATC